MPTAKVSLNTINQSPLVVRVFYLTTLTTNYFNYLKILWLNRILLTT